jgi:hypothetical protein
MGKMPMTLTGKMPVLRREQRETTMDTNSSMKLLACLSLALAGVLALGDFAASPAAPRTLVVEAGKHDRVNVPVSVEAPADANYAQITLDGKPVPCQIADGRLWFVVDNLPAGKMATFSVEFDAARDSSEYIPASPRVKLKKADKQIDVAIGDKAFTSYVFDYGKAGKNQFRRPYLWPVYGPGQLTMTRPYPMQYENLPKNVATDHPHHTSIWVAHGDVNKVDNWTIGPKSGWQVHKDFPLLADGPVVGIIRETLDWTDADRKPNLAETRTIRVYNLPDTGRVMDFELTFEAKYGKATFGDTKEGGPLAIRMRTEFQADKNGDKGILVNSQGQQADKAWGCKARWVDCSGMVEGKRYGYAMFDSAENLRHPETWHARTYGLCAVNPFGLSDFPGDKKVKGDWTIEAGQSATLRYRVYFHPGDAKQAGVDARWNDYAEPPAVRWK